LKFGGLINRHFFGLAASRKLGDDKSGRLGEPSRSSEVLAQANTVTEETTHKHNVPHANSLGRPALGY
jgi:hypothetical protein